MTLRPNRGTSSHGFGLQLPLIFSSLEEARNALDYHSNQFRAFLRSIELGQIESEDETELGRKFWRNLLRKWDDAFESYLQITGPTLDERSQQAALVLKMDHRIAIALFTYPISQLLNNQMKWDIFLPQVRILGAKPSLCCHRSSLELYSC